MLKLLSHSDPRQSLADSAFLLEPFEDAATLVEMPGMSPLDSFLQEPLELVGPEITYSSFDITARSPAAPLKMNSMPSLDSATSSTGEEHALDSPIPHVVPACMPSVSPSATRPISADMCPSPETSEMAIEPVDSDVPAASTLSPRQAASELHAAKGGQTNPPRPRDRRRRQQSTFTVSKLAKQREKNRRCQRSFRERQKVKQEAQMQELQDLRDRCAWLEAQLAAHK